ncbi:N-acyl amino acid synthase FeeM domain-containing protein [Serpentinimonas barnesii]|uniref:N-acyl amino acid synthase FeeM domain-containing protein n=1 Tax=Serpentinimonas barnesii TaxID=1458427 RepID=UPI0006940145|nr:hypothetical protein [Serpentinimonas barnesii]
MVMISDATGVRADALQRPRRFPVHTEASVQRTEHWPFTVRLASGEQDMAKVLEIRHSAYARHLPEALSASLRQPEAMDRAEGVVMLLAESKLDGSPMGTMRIQTNRAQALALEQSVQLPQWMQGLPLAEATRLGVSIEGSARLVKVALFKAYYLYCLQAGIRYMVITARSPLDRQYERMLFQDVYPHLGYIPLSHVFNLPHRVLNLDVQNVREQWEEVGHPMLDFMCHTRHPDLQL